ncbi:hypothetical protein SOVF_149480, partial [Spinacia oleracea]
PIPSSFLKLNNLVTNLIVFDWKTLKYPQTGSSSRPRPAAKPALNPGPSAERAERTSGIL